MADRYGSAIFWHEGLARVSRPPLAGSCDVDVAIVGAGFTGLWTAYHLLCAEPSLRIAILDSGELAFGASGRNGGFAMTLLDMSLAHLRRNHGDAAARAAHEAVASSVEAMGDTIAAEGIDCDWTHGGLMVVATSQGQLRRVRADLDAAEAMGLSGFKALDAAELRAEVDSPTYLGGLFEEHCAVVQPAKLVCGLAAAVERRGASIYEDTSAQSVELEGGKVRIATGGGNVVADQVVLAANAWARNLPWFSRTVVALYTYVLMTEPLTDSQWASVGWERRQGIEDKRNFVHYYRRTADGRILWGGRDGVVHAQVPGRPGIRPTYDRSDVVHKRLIATFRQTFPQLDAVRFTHHWGGPVGITAKFLPQVGSIDGGPIHYGHGYNGHGVAPTHTVGRILAGRVLGVDSGLDDLCFVDADAVRFPPEPLLWLSAELTRQAMLRQDRQLDEGRDVGDMDPWLLRVMNKLT